MLNLDDSNRDLFDFLLDAVLTNVDCKNFRLCNPSDVIDNLKRDNGDLLAVLEHFEIISTFILVIEQCHAGIDEARTRFASELLTAYLKS